jgi:CDP-diacylglycerol--glycerol-3-phosphate 3-phosphatidyltransferase
MEDKENITEDKEKITEDKEKITDNKDQNKNKVFTLPNIITIFRILLIPLFAVVMFDDMIWGLILFLLCASTDLLDGWIARRFNMISNVGKFLDPVADKLMHITVMVCLSVIYAGKTPPFYILTIILASKEFIMLLVGLILITKNVVTSANIYGKLAAGILSVGVVVMFFGEEQWVYIFGFVVSAVGVAFALVAMVIYGLKIISQLRGRKDKSKKLEIDMGLMSGYKKEEKEGEINGEIKDKDGEIK